MNQYFLDEYKRYVFIWFTEIKIKANTPGEAWAKLMGLGKYFSEQTTDKQTSK